ncbi:FK506-binding protein [Sergentomyia squamirostris]
MVFGLVLTPNKKYSQKVEKDFQISNAALDTKTCGTGETQLLITVDKNNFLICTLTKEKPQYCMDMQLSAGMTIAFCSVGSGTIHLTGYMLPDQEDFMRDEMMMGSDEEEAEDEESEDEELDAPPELVPIKKGKKVEVEDDDEEDDDSDDDEEEDSDDDDDEEEEDDDDSDEEEEEVQPQQKKKKLELPQNGLGNGVTSKKDKKELKKQKKDEKQQPAQQKKEAAKENQQKSGKKTVRQGGVIVEDLKVGDGPEAEASKKVSVYYEGRLKSNNKVFDSCKSGSGFKFIIGRGEVIRGWDVGVAGMKIGGKRRITCPPQMAYGAKGSPPVIPPNSTLVFEVELRHVKN